MSTVQLPLIGITGKRGAGKDTLAALIVQDRRYHRAALADSLKNAVQAIYGLTHAQVHGTIQDKETVDPRWGLTPRYILQKFGTDVARSIHEETWTRSLLDVHFVEEEKRSWYVGKPWARYVMPLLGIFGIGHRGWVVPDVRFVNEADAIRRHGGIVVRVIRPGTGALDAAGQHASETEMDRIVADIEVVNDGAPEDMRARVDEIVALATAKKLPRSLL